MSNKTKPEDQEWVTSEGEVIKLGDMASDHLLNVIRFLERGIKTAEAYDGRVHKRALERLAQAKAVASSRGLLMPDGKTPTFEEQTALAEVRMREQFKGDLPREVAARGGGRPIEVDKEEP